MQGHRAAVFRVLYFLFAIHIFRKVPENKSQTSLVFQVNKSGRTNRSRIKLHNHRNIGSKIRFSARNVSNSHKSHIYRCGVIDLLGRPTRTKTHHPGMYSRGKPSTRVYRGVDPKSRESDLESVFDAF